MQEKEKQMTVTNTMICKNTTL